MTWPDIFGSDSDARACRKRLWLHGNEQFLQPKLQAESRDANDAIFLSIENMAISSATKSYFNPFWARLQRVRKKTPSTAQVDFWFSWEQALWCLGLALESLVIMQVIRWSCHMPHWPAASSFLSPNLRNPVWMILPKKYCFWTAWTCSKRNLASEKRKAAWPSNFLLCPLSAWESRDRLFAAFAKAIRGLHNPRALLRWPLFCKTHWGENGLVLRFLRLWGSRWKMPSCIHGCFLHCCVKMFSF